MACELPPNLKLERLYFETHLLSSAIGAKTGLRGIRFHLPGACLSLMVGQVLADNHFLGCDVRGKVRGTPRTLLLETLQKFLKLGTYLGLL